MKQNRPHTTRIHSRAFQLIRIRNPHSTYSGLVRSAWLLPRIQEYLVLEQLGQSTAAQQLWQQIRHNAVASQFAREGEPSTGLRGRFLTVRWYVSNGVADLHQSVGNHIHDAIQDELIHRRNQQIDQLRSETKSGEQSFSMYQAHMGHNRHLHIGHTIEFTPRWPKIAREIHRAVRAIVIREGGRFANIKSPSIDPRVQRTWARIKGRLDPG